MAAAMILATVPACSIKEDLTPDEGEGIVLRFFSDESLVVTKATTEKEGVDALNENVLASVEYFIYSNAQKSGNAVLHGYLQNVRQNAPVSIPMTIETVNSTLCPNGATNFWVYAIANHPRIVAAGDPEDLSGTDVATISALTRDIEFDGDDVKTPQTNFLMSTDGQFEVTGVKRRSTIVATANIGLKRVAAKITVAVRVVPSVEIRNTVTISGVTDTRTEVWRPRLDEMYIYLVNGAKTGQVSGEPLDGSDLFQYQQVVFDQTAGESHSYDTYTKKVDPDTGEEILDADGLVQYDKTTETGIFYPATSPFYTYPEEWMYGSDEEPYLKLAIPWDRDAGTSDLGTPFGTTHKIYYYRVYCPATPIDISNAQFLRNNWYKVILNVGILGSETEGGEMVISGQYYVVDWQERETGGGGSGTGINDSDKEAEIKGARYLFLNEQDFVMYNQEDLMIPYVTSDPCIIENFSATKYDFSGSSKQEVTTTSPAAWNMDVSLVTASTGAHIKFNHPLNNDTSTDDYDVSPYIITFTIRHKDDPSYSKVVTIEQRQAMFIESEYNNASSSKGYVWIYGRQNTDKDNWYYVSGSLGTGVNSNPNMYVINVSVLDAASNYSLGDPRETTINNLSLTDEYASIEGGTRALSYYYRTSRGDEMRDVIAPVFRIASSYGVCGNSFSLDNAEKRCASYQEYGYPAGRWRVPTRAELEFITTLSAKGFIPSLFNVVSDSKTSIYWSSQGIMNVLSDGTVRDNTTSYSTAWVRCVYDQWYWGSDKLSDMNVFTWGDIAR